MPHPGDISFFISGPRIQTARAVSNSGFVCYIHTYIHSPAERELDVWLEGQVCQPKRYCRTDSLSKERGADILAAFWTDLVSSEVWIYLDFEKL